MPRTAPTRRRRRPRPNLTAQAGRTWRPKPGERIGRPVGPGQVLKPRRRITRTKSAATKKRQARRRLG